MHSENDSAHSTRLEIWVEAQTYHDRVGQYTTFWTGPYESDAAAIETFRQWERFDHAVDGISDVEWDVFHITREEAIRQHEVYTRDISDARLTKIAEGLTETHAPWRRANGY